jgi:uncharacterized protein YcgI (DUF1989 family)
MIIFSFDQGVILAPGGDPVKDFQPYNISKVDKEADRFTPMAEAIPNTSQWDLRRSHPLTNYTRIMPSQLLHLVHLSPLGRSSVLIS